MPPAAIIFYDRVQLRDPTIDPNLLPIVSDKDLLTRTIPMIYVYRIAILQDPIYSSLIHELHPLCQYPGNLSRGNLHAAALKLLVQVFAHAVNALIFSKTVSSPDRNLKSVVIEPHVWR
jgi:hypothetical protein